MTERILLVDDDRAFRLSTAALLEEEGFEVEGAQDASEATASLRSDRFDLILLDLRMPGIDGIDLVEVLRTRGQSIPVLMVSGYGTVDSAVRALHTGADDFVTKPVEPDTLLERIRSLLDRRPDPDAASPDSPGAPGTFGSMVGRSPEMQKVFRELRQVAATDATVLLCGETGTGKELAARAVHDLSSRAQGAFVAVNCGALAEGVLESELFGHVRGAFTGAVKDRDGLFRAANGGTLFLDEIGDVPPGLQQRLLRALQEREVTPVGASRSIRVDVRLIAASNRDLRTAVEAGSFREDLFFRLNVYRLDLPPLKDRSGDIPVLVEHFLRRKVSGAAPPMSISPLAMRTLLAHHWPGNVRELFAALESAIIRAGGGPVQASHLPAEVREASGISGDTRYRADDVEMDEKEAIRRALDQADGVRVRAAELLGMGRTTLWRKMKEYGLG
ncbi:MAG: sigma-54 dependent transcriptional regulator [Gemmatimonadota bacterium]